MFGQEIVTFELFKTKLNDNKIQNHQTFELKLCQTLVASIKKIAEDVSK